ncbi:MAG: mechanosensitive ion channel family protein [Candidatus Methanofastidiosia archaeon]|jgi:small-conductance mechanosensitive channel
MIDIFSYTLYKDVTVYNLIFFAVVVVISVLIARILRSNIRRAFREKVSTDILNVLERIVYYAIIGIGAFSALPQLGVDLTGLLVAGGIVGIVVGFASQSVVSNLISGLFLIFERPVKIGEQIQVEDISGIVTDIRVLSTTVRTYDGTYVRIPNEKVFSSEITNYVANPVRRFNYTIGIAYKDNAEKAIKTILNTVENHPFVLKNPSPNVYLKSLGDSSVNIMVRVWVPSVVWYDVKRELLLKIKVDLEDAGISIPFPQRVLHFASDKTETPKLEIPPGLETPTETNKVVTEPDPQSQLKSKLKS